MRDRASGSCRQRAIAQPIALRRGLYLAVSVALVALLTGHARAAASPAAGGSPEAAKSPDLSLVQVIERHIAARGGLTAWRNVQTIAMGGHMDVGGQKNLQVPFRSQLKRPRKQRFELEFNGQKAVQIYDGIQGWKIRPYLGRNDAEPYTSEEQRQAAESQELDGPLIEYKAKGTKVALEGLEAVEGHDAYKLRLTFKDGTVRHDWIDAKSFLEVKIEGEPRRLDGRPRNVEIYYRDYRPVNGLMIPHLLETAVQGVKGTHKMTLENVEVNARIDDSAFAKPQVMTASVAATARTAAHAAKSR